MRALLPIIFILISGNAWAQLSLGVDVGFTMPADQYRIPKPNQNYGVFIDPRPGFMATLSGQQNWDNVSAYVLAGWMYYRTFQGIGPFLHPSGIGIEPPTYHTLERWVGSYFEIGARKTVFRHPWVNVEAGIGAAYHVDITHIDSEFPNLNEGWLEIPGSVYYEQQMTWLTPHSFSVSPHLRIWRTNRQGHRMWLKAQYNQGLNKTATGSFDIYRVALDNTQTYGFSFDVALRHSFYSFTLGYELFAAKPKMEAVTQ